MALPRVQTVSEVFFFFLIYYCYYERLNAKRLLLTAKLNQPAGWRWIIWWVSESSQTDCCCSAVNFFPVELHFTVVNRDEIIPVSVGYQYRYWCWVLIKSNMPIPRCWYQLYVYVCIFFYICGCIAVKLVTIAPFGNVGLQCAIVNTKMKVLILG